MLQLSPSLPSRLAHLTQCCILLVTLIVVIYYHNSTQCQYDVHHKINMIENYGYTGSILVTCLHFAPFPPLIVTCVLTLTSYILYSSFHYRIKSHFSPQNAPFICFRTVTRGYFPKLVTSNAQRNKNLCVSMGLKNFQVEVVTDIEIKEWKDDPHINQTVVPDSYRTPKGTLFKARALQYALEDHVNTLSDNAWIVHLDEESLLTPNSVNGILNFVCCGKYPIGQGIITYANENVINWFTTFLDCFRVGDDIGKMRTQLQVLHFLVTEWKGSFLVCQAQVEKSISFDHGPDGSISEDIYFGLQATNQGYSMNFIEGEMWEKSPFTMLDCIKQRKRWMEGIHCIAFKSTLPFRRRIMFIWLMLTMFLTQGLLYFTLCHTYLPLSCGLKCVQDICISLTGITYIYIHIIGAVKSYLLYPQIGHFKLALFILGSPIAMTINGLIILSAGIFNLFTKRSNFDIVNKEYYLPVIQNV